MKTKTKYHIIGVMSGTSLDGIDLVEIIFKFSMNSKWSFKIIRSETIAYTKYWTKTLAEAIGYSAEKLEKLDFKYTDHLAETINYFIKKNQISEIDAVCSHGHTILHQPARGFTLQIGNLPRLSQLINQTVVCDFRTQDIEMGGQGAPLVPIGDKLLFGAYDYCLNLGGFANISFDKNGVRLAYDICPVNIVLNKYAEQLNLPYDDKGNLAKRGKIHFELLEKLNSLSFYSEKSPKSLGLEWVLKNIFPLIENYNLPQIDILSTFTEHIAIQLGKQITKNKTKPEDTLTVAITGGGAYNLFLIERIKSLIKVNILIPSKEIVEFKEALIFGFLGVLKLRGEINCLASVTGASADHSSGKIYN